MTELGRRAWERPVIWLYRAYRKKLPWLGGYRGQRDGAPPVEDERLRVEYDEANATDVGDLYRGYGLLVAIAFVGVLYTESFHGRASFLVRLALMAFMLVVVLYVNFGSGLRNEWSARRLESERNRYAALDRKLASRTSDEELVAQCRFHLRGQLAYNDDCHGQYHALDRIASCIVWGGFGILLANTLLELFHVEIADPTVRALWMALRFLPCLAIGLLVFNAFINLWRLKDHHEETAGRLREMMAALDAPAPGVPIETASREMRDYLQAQDSKWTRYVEGMFIMPGG